MMFRPKKKYKLIERRVARPGPVLLVANQQLHSYNMRHNPDYRNNYIQDKLDSNNNIRIIICPQGLVGTFTGARAGHRTQEGHRSVQEGHLHPADQAKVLTSDRNRDAHFWNDCRAAAFCQNFV